MYAVILLFFTDPINCIKIMWRVSIITLETGILINVIAEVRRTLKTKSRERSSTTIKDLNKIAGILIVAEGSLFVLKEEKGQTVEKGQVR